MRILVWHVHGAWTTSFVHTGHTCLVPVTPGRDADGRGRARTYPWPDNAVEVTPDELRESDVDVVLLQRPHELELAEKWLGRRPGRDVPAVYVEHDTPRGPAPDTRHPMADQDAVPIAHVTPFNRVYWDNGRAPSTVVEHGVLDPGHRFTGERASAGVVVNDPVRRGRLVGTDLLPEFARAAPLEVFGMGVRGLGEHLALPADRITEHDDLPQQRMHAELARCRVYVHPFRWTSLGLALIEAMLLGLPVVALDATEAGQAVPTGGGLTATRPELLTAAVRRYRADPELARRDGLTARAAAAARYSLSRFRRDWDRLLEEVTR